MEDSKDIVVIVVDSLRYKDLAIEDDLAPFIQGQADSGIWSQTYYSTSPWTAPAHASLLTGSLPSEHGTTTENTYFDSEPSLLSDLPNEYYALALSENGLFSPSLGFDEGFDNFVSFGIGHRKGESWREIWERDDEFSGRLEKYLEFSKELIANKDLASLGSLIDHLRQKFGRLTNPGFIDEITGEIQNELDKSRSSFIFANLMPAHYPYTFSPSEERKYLADVDSETIETAIASYDHEAYLADSEVTWNKKNLDIRKKGYLASISYVDRKIKNLYERAPEDTIFVVLGDHGELFGEQEVQGQPIIGHHFGTYEELIHVPLIIFSKGDPGLQLSTDDLRSHASFYEIIQALTGSVDLESKEVTRSEYFGLKGYYQQFDREYPRELEEPYSRKSFSFVTKNKNKVDLTTDGLYDWNISDLVEKRSSQPHSELRSKLRILYDHNFD